MKIAKRILFVLFCLYAISISAIFYGFHNAEKYKENIESLLSSHFQQTVSIELLKTTWVDKQPTFLLQGLRVENKETEEVFASISEASAKLSFASLFYFWPILNELSVDHPYIQVESMTEGSFRIAGKSYIPSPTQQKRSKFILAWLSSQKNVDINNGEFIWRHREGKQTEVNAFSAQYRTNGKQRTLISTASHQGDNLSISFDVQGNAIWSSDWDADFELTSENNLNTENNIKITGVVRQGVGSINSANIRSQRLVDVMNIVGRGQFLNKWLSASQLQGELHELSATFTGALFDLDKWQLSAATNGLQWKSAYGMPGLNSLNAVFRVNESEGVLAFNTTDAVLTLAEIFEKPISINKLSGELLLVKSLESWNWTLNNGEFGNADVQLEDLRIALTKTEKKAKHLVMTSAVSSQDLSKLERYFPATNNNSIKFKNWWKNAISPDTSIDGTVSYIGSVNGQALKQGDADLILDIDAMNVALDYGYKNDWPVLQSKDLKLTLENRTLSMRAEKATFDDIGSDKVKIDIDDVFNTGRVIQFGANLNGKPESLINFLQDGPLNTKQRKNKLRFTSNKGSFKGLVKASIPLGKSKESGVKVTGNARLTDTSLSVGSNLNLKSINGQIDFTQESFSARGLTGELLNGPISADIVTVKKGKPPAFNIYMTGEGDASKLGDLISPQIASRLSGRTQWEAELAMSKDNMNLNIKSDLKGVKVALPKPLTKVKNEIRPLNVTLKDGKSFAKSLTVKAGDDLFIKLASNSVSGGLLLDKGVISIGNDQGIDEAIEGIDIFASGEELDLDSWLDAIAEMSKVASRKSSEPNFIDRLRRINITSKDFYFLNKPFGETNVFLSSGDGRDWKMELDSQIANGLGQLQPFLNTPKYQLYLDKLYWPVNKELSKEEDDLAEKRPETYPELMVKVRDFRFKEQKFGELDFHAKPIGRAWLIERVNISGNRYSVQGTGEWQENRTDLDIKIKTEADGQSENDFDLDKFLVGGNGELDAKLHWQGAPTDFKSEKMKGNYRLKIEDGVFPKVNADKGRIFGLLNINTLSRRLRLDFGDIFGTGLAFDTLESSGSINDGDIQIGKFFIYSPSVFVESQGKVNFKDESYDLEMKVSPQLGGNIALLTALSNPAAGAVVWVVDKLFKGKLNQVVVYSYDIEGDWDNPSIERTSNQNNAEPVN